MLSVEKSLVGMCFQERDNFARAVGLGVTAECFEEPLPRQVWEEMAGAERAGKIIDLTTIGMRLPEIAIDLVQMTELTPVAENFEAYAREVLAAANHRRFTQCLRDAYHAAGLRKPFSSRDHFVEVLDRATQFLAHGSAASLSLQEALITQVTDMEHRILTAEAGKGVGIASGLTVLDRLTGGFQPGRLYVLAARPGIGKTTLSCNFATTAARAGHPVLMMTVEMPAPELAGKILSLESAVPSSRMSSGNLTPDQMDQIVEVSGRIVGLPIWLNDSFRRSYPALKIEAQRLHRQGQCKLLVVDYLQQLKIPGERWGSRQAELTEITAGLKELAMSLQIPIIVLAQINREAEKSKGEAPTMAQLKDSGSTEQDADGVIILYQDSDENYRISLAKNRIGAKADFMVRADLAVNAFRDAT